MLQKEGKKDAMEEVRVLTELHHDHSRFDVD